MTQPYPTDPNGPFQPGFSPVHEPHTQPIHKPIPDEPIHPEIPDQPPSPDQPRPM
jgi:hypothetical protein